MESEERAAPDKAQELNRMLLQGTVGKASSSQYRADESTLSHKGQGTSMQPFDERRYLVLSLVVLE